MDPKPSSPAVRSRCVLHSWKQISDYLQVTPRTAQRWHLEESLPAHHLGAGPKARVAAYSDELDAWAADEQRRAVVRSQSAGALKTSVYRWRVASVTLCALLVISSGLFAYRFYFYAGPPSRAVVEGATLAVYDYGGRLCWRRELPGLNPEAYIPLSNLAFRTAIPTRFDAFLIEDIDGDGNREVLLNYWPKPMPESPGKLICFEKNGKIRWEFRFGRERIFDGRQLGSNYRGVLLRMVHAHGRRWILSISHHDPGFPAQAAVLDPQTGKVHQEYWHPGWIVHSQVCDLDGDGSQEILLAGYNNPGPGPGHAGLAVLKVAAIAQPLAPDPVGPDFKAFSGGGEMAYLLFPRSDLVTAEGMIPYVDMLEVYDGKRILVRTQGPQYANLVYYLDFRLRLLQFAMDDGFASVHEQRRRRGVLDHRLTQREIAELAKVQSFTSTPDGNNPKVSRFWNLP